MFGSKAKQLLTWKLVNVDKTRLSAQVTMGLGRNLPAAAAKSLQSCPTLCDPIDGSPPGSAVPGILQARTLEWIAISLSNAWKWKVKVKSLSRVRLFMTPWTTAHPAPLSMGFSRQEYWSHLFSNSWDIDKRDDSLPLLIVLIFLLKIQWYTVQIYQENIHQ